MKDCYVVSTRELEMNSDSGAFDSLGPSTPVAVFPTLEEAEQYQCAYMRWWLASNNTVVISEYVSVLGVAQSLRLLKIADFALPSWTPAELAADLKVRPLSEQQIKSLCSVMSVVRIDAVLWSPPPLRVLNNKDVPTYSTSSIRM